ncbi:MAG TPA: ATP-dependent DNA helicase RecQ [Candidatus Baltobacteraceae bacterium]|nr:ATP-dependent DNA helicase RecQ [Candidatus Baltobacteraceae bacterium]
MTTLAPTNRRLDGRLQNALLEYFGFEEFNSGQEEVITSILDGHDTLAILATGAGKSLCYQLPALLFEGTTVVVSPLIALMKDQVDTLASYGIKDVAALNSTVDEDRETAILERIASGTTKIVLVTPERLEDERFLKVLREITIPLFVVDEAHCISAWGHDFRPAYLALGHVIAQLGRPRVLALTATATPSVRDDILTQLGLVNTRVIVRGFDRPNLIYEVCRTTNEAEKLRALKDLFATELTGTGIIYTSTIKNALDVQRYLTESLDVPASVYHSKLRKNERTVVHELFMQEKIRAVVATNAFGLGIDKSNIRFVVHYDLPGSVEAYTQESGRAGRDGEPSRCILLYRMGDVHVQNYFLTGKYPQLEEVQKVFGTLEYFARENEGVSLTDLRKISQLPLTKLKVVLALLKKAHFIEMRSRARYGLTQRAIENRDLVLNLANYETKRTYDQSKLAMILQYAESRSCRRRFLLNYFGEEAASPRCGACDNCLRSPEHSSTVFETGLRITDLVAHPKFGQGTVERVEKDLVTVLFPSFGYKTLLASAVHRENKIA